MNEAYKEIGIKRCPCGEYPSQVMVDDGDSVKWNRVSGDCCGDWEIEFRSDYKTGAALYSAAKDAWNNAKRFYDE
jgi:hypothetical protein